MLRRAAKIKAESSGKSTAESTEVSQLDPLLEPFVELRLARCRTSHLLGGPEFADHPDVTAHLRKMLSPVLKDARANGSAEIFEHEGKLCAALLFRCDEHSFFGQPTCELLLDCNMQIPAAVVWVRKKLSELAETPQFQQSSVTTSTTPTPSSSPTPPPLVCMLHVSCLDFLPDLMRHGFGIDSVLLQGSVKAGVERLQKKRDLSACLQLLGVKCEVLSSEAEIEQVSKLSLALFSAHPEFCWFGANLAVVERDAHELRAALNAKKPTHFVLKKEDVVLGYFGFSTGLDPLYRGIHAGLTLMLHPSLQGKGLARPVYQKLLQEMAEHHVEIFKGGTSQPAVLALSHEMGRVLQAVLLRRGAHAFGHAHFAPYL